MSFVALVIASTVAAAPTYTVTVTRRVGVDADKSLEFAKAFAVALDAAAGKPVGKLMAPEEFLGRLSSLGMLEPSSCAGKVACALDAGKVGLVDRLVAIQLIKIPGP